jgi:hypothetical protein
LCRNVNTVMSPRGAPWLPGDRAGRTGMGAQGMYS